MTGRKRTLLKFISMAAMLFGLPLLGVTVAGHPVMRYLEFPPKTHYVGHAGFSWSAFTLCGLAILTVSGAFIIGGFRTQTAPAAGSSAGQRFPCWGWLGLGAGVISWALAWTRFEWFAGLQTHTFTLLWFSFIVVINGLCYRKTGGCLMKDRPGYFLLLFPVSAAFWWFFEYLNRFVQNWYYLGPDFSAWQYFWYATLPFSTVLPAVLSTQQWLLSSYWIGRRYGKVTVFRVPCPRVIAAGVLVLSALGLAGIGVWPNYLFPLLWLSPLFIMVTLQILLGEPTIIDEIAAGDWRAALSSAVAALACGWFWEMWNFYSLAKWQYSIPFVHRFQIFEMPVLGYAGYLPFGLECAVVGGMVDKMLRN